MKVVEKDWNPPKKDGGSWDADLEVCGLASDRQWPRGQVIVNRPNRSAPRKFSRSDLKRITRYVACEHGTGSVLCTVTDALGIREDVQEIGKAVLGMRAIVGGALDGEQWGVSARDVLEGLQMVGDLLASVRAGLGQSRVANWLLRAVGSLLKRFGWVSGIEGIFDLAMRLLDLAQSVEIAMSRIEDVAALLACGELEVSVDDYKRKR